jgi:hypothetical protein
MHTCAVAGCGEVTAAKQVMTDSAGLPVAIPLCSQHYGLMCLIDHG